MSPSSQKLLSSPPGRVGLVILTVLVVSGASILLFQANLNLPFPLLEGIIVTLIGFASGLSTRWLLRRSRPSLRLLSALGALLAGLALLGAFSSGAIGLQLAAQRASGPDWGGLLKFLWGSAVAWLTLRAWRKSLHIKRPAARKPKVKARPRQSRSASKPASWISLPKIEVPGFVKPQAWRKLVKGLKRRSADLGKGLRRSPGIQVGPRRGSSNRLRPPARRLGSSSGFKRRSKQVQLVGGQEHHCPFCLQVVTRGDPRGVKICSICKTWHHADCWAVTGSCQVPHDHK
jgi:hypothetical protein